MPESSHRWSQDSISGRAIPRERSYELVGPPPCAQQLTFTGQTNTEDNLLGDHLCMNWIALEEMILEITWSQTAQGFVGQYQHLELSTEIYWESV